MPLATAICWRHILLGKWIFTPRFTLFSVLVLHSAYLQVMGSHVLFHQSQREFCLISVAPDFTFNNSCNMHAGVSAPMLWVGIVQRMKQERDTFIIETLPGAITTASPLFSKHSEDACLYAIALPQSVWQKSFKWRFKGRKSPEPKGIRVQFWVLTPGRFKIISKTHMA